MGSLIKNKGHQLLSFSYENIRSDIYGDVTLAGKNLNPDPLFRVTNPNGRMKYFKVGRPPKPDSWGVFVKGPSATAEFSEQNGYPLPLGDEPYFDLDQPLINGQPLPEKRDYVDIAQPEAARAVIFVTGDKAYPTGWYAAGHAFRMKNSNRITSPDVYTIGVAGTRTEPFQMSGSLGSAFFLPTAPKDAVSIVFYLTNVQSTSLAALSAPLFEQYEIKLDDIRKNTVEFRGPLKTGKRAATENRTKLSYWGGAGGFNIDEERSTHKNEAYDVEFAYQLVDESGKSAAAFSKSYHVGKNAHKHFRFHPKLSSLSNVVKDSVQGWTPYVRYKKGSNWGAWKSIKKKGADNVFALSTYVPVFGPEWRKDSKFDLVKGQPGKKDTTGLANPTEPMGAVDTTVPLNSSGLQLGKHRVKTVLYDDGQPSEPSAATVLNLTATNQVPRIYQPFFTNRLDNPDLIDVNPTANRPRDWTFNRDARTTYERGRLTVDETDGQAARGDLVITPYGYIALNEMRYNGRIIIEQNNHITGKAVDVLMEYRVDSYSATGVPTVTFLKQSTLGVHRRNGRYTLGFRTGATRERDSIPLHAQTNLVVIKTIGDGSDPELGVRNYTTIRKGHGIFHTMAPDKRKTAEYLDKVDWWETDEESYPHGGYCKVIASGEDQTISGITMNMNDTGVDIPGNVHLNGTSEAEKTIEVRFRTGEHVTAGQFIYKAGDANQGYALSISSGQVLNYRMWHNGANVVNLSTPIQKHRKYMASMVRSADGFTAYLDGVQVGTSTATAPAFVVGGIVSAGYNNGTARGSTGLSVSGTQPMIGRLYEVRVWKNARSADAIARLANKTIPDADDKNALALYLRMDEMEGTTVYDNTGNGSNATIIGDSRWINGDLNAAWRDGSSVIDRINFKDNSIQSPWTVAGVATHTLGDFSAERFSRYGMRITGGGTNLKYLQRSSITLSGTSSALGVQQRFLTLPVGGDVTILQGRDASGVVYEAQLTPQGRLQFRGPGSGAWTTFLGGVEPGERMYVELKAENLGTANGILRAYVAATHDEELMQVNMLTGLDFTGRGTTIVRAGVCAVSASVTNSWDFHMGTVIVSNNGKVRKEYLPGNYVEYYGPDGTPTNERYGLYDLGLPLTPGTTMTQSIYAMCEGLAAGEDRLLGATIYNADDEPVSELDYLVKFDDIESDWKRHTQTFTVPSDGAYMMYDRNDIGQGHWRIQALQIEEGGSATAFTARYNMSGHVRVKFDSVINGCEPGKPMEVLGKAEELLSVGFTGFEDNNTSITLQVASSDTENGVYTAYHTNLANLPRNRWYELRANLSTTDRDTSPILKGLYMNFKRAFPMLHKPDGSEYKGGTVINNMPAPVGRRLMEIHQMEDGSGGFTTWGSENPTRWIEEFEVHVFRDSTLDEIVSNVGKGDSTFVVEYGNVLYTIRVIDPIEFETHRASRIGIRQESEDFYWYSLRIPRAEVLRVQDL